MFCFLSFHYSLMKMAVAGLAWNDSYKTIFSNSINKACYDAKMTERARTGTFFACRLICNSNNPTEMFGNMYSSCAAFSYAVRRFRAELTCCWELRCDVSIRHEGN